MKQLIICALFLLASPAEAVDYVRCTAMRSELVRLRVILADEFRKSELEAQDQLCPITMAILSSQVINNNPLAPSEAQKEWAKCRTSQEVKAQTAKNLSPTARQQVIAQDKLMKSLSKEGCPP